MDNQQIYSGRRVKAAMEQASNHNVDGIILGPSHAEVGIIPELLDGYFVNLALSSQDLYYNYAALRYCCECHYEKIQNMSILILDLCDYIYFNYDVSLCKEIRNYLKFGGMEDPHNYIYNRHYSQPWDELVKEAHSVIPAEQDRITRIVSDTEIENYPCTNSLRVKRYDQTVEENKKVLYKLLELVYTINPSMRVYCITLPHYCETRKLLADSLDRWHDEYYEIIQNAKAQFDFKFLDYIYHDISTKRNYYYDPTHFNVEGAAAFTEILKNDMK